MRSSGHFYCGMTLYWNLCAVFLNFNLRLWVLSKKTTKVKCHFHPSYQVITLPIRSMGANAGLHHLAEEGLSVFSTVNLLIFLFSHYWVFGRVKVYSSYLMSKGSWFTSSKVWTYVIYLQFFLMGDFSLLHPRLSIYSIFYLYQYHVVDIYFTFGL